MISERPYYSTGGWGSGASGDREGAYVFDLCMSILKSINANIVTVNTTDVSDLDNLLSMERKLKKIKALKSKALKLGLNPDFSDLEKEGLKFSSYYDKHNKPNVKSGKGENPSAIVSKLETAARVFLDAKGASVKIDGYTVTPSSVKFKDTLVAFRTSENKIVLNSQQLSVSSFESRVLGGQSIIQKTVRSLADLSIPLNVLESANLKLNETKVLEKGPEEDFTFGGENRHFTGALLLENSGRKFLMDLDRREIEHGIWNPFFCEVDSKSRTIEEAYDSMIPAKVKEAMSKGIKVLRQGEWFFIKTDKTVKVGENQYFRWESNENRDSFGVHTARISHGKGRPNTLLIVKNSQDESMNGLVCGVVEHSGREHKPLSLGGTVSKFSGYHDSRGLRTSELTSNPYSIDEGESMTLDLWEVHGNTTVSNFTIQGDVD